MITSVQLFDGPLTLSQTTNFKFEEENFEFYEDGKKFSKRVGNASGKGEIARYEQFLLFPKCFQKTCNADK